MDEIKKIGPEKKATQGEEITPEAKDAGFHEFPEGASSGSGWKFSLPKFGGFNLGGRGLGKIGIIIGVALVILLVVIGIPGFLIYNSARKVQASGTEFYQALQAQNLEQSKNALVKTKADLQALDSILNFLSWTSILPFAGNYWKDAKAGSRGGVAGLEASELILKTVEPYADILGFNGGQQAEDGAKTAEDRIEFITNTIGDIVPQLSPISEKTIVMKTEFDKIDPNRYPEHFRGTSVREPLRKGIELVDQVHEFVTGGKPVLEQMPYLLGVDGERTYLFLWQNDKELRPTGGFITAYSIIKVKNGKVEPSVSNDIYNLDNKLTNKEPAPEPIKKYLKQDKWHLRDMNLSPDVKVSMDKIMENYEKTRSPKVDGVVVMDTKLAVDLLSVIGRIGVPGFGNFSSENDSRCNCPVVIYELESYADVAGPIVWDDISGQIVFKPPHADNRKAILGPLMNSILANAMGQPKEKIPELFSAGFNAVREKHVMFYFGTGAVQEAMEAFNLAGRIKDYDGDYLHISDSNFAGAKSNLYVEQAVELTVDTDKTSSMNTLVIKYKNPQKHDGWLNGPFRDWVRVYVPKGSELIDSTGSEVPFETSEDLGKTVFTGFFTLRPEGILELKLEYKTPVVQKNDYKILIQKQPGTNNNMYRVEVDGKAQEFGLKVDKELRF